MSHDPPPSVRAAAERARWLAERASTLDHAHRLLRRLAETEAKGREAIAIGARIAELRAEVDRIRRGQSTPIEVTNPYWIE